MRRIFFACFFLLGVLAHAQVWPWVDPRIGSVGVGRTFPGPCMPFGMVKPGPDCGVLPNAGWAPMPEPVLGFSQTHVSGTGGGQKYGNILIQPVLETLPDSAYLWAAYPQRRISETIELGYYSTTYENGIRTDITTSERCAFYRFHFPSAGSLFVDVTHFLGKDTIPNLRERQQFVGSEFQVVGPHEVIGHSSVRGGWNNGDAYTVYFCLLADQPFTAEGCCLHFNDTLVNVKIGISYVSTEQARRNILDRSFESQLVHLRDTWEQQLSKIQIEGTEQQRRMFYTALYHTMLMPVEKTGEDPHADNSSESETSSYYDDYYAIWDTYRTSSPLLTLLCPDRQTAIVNALLNIYKRDGYLPDARSGDCNGRTQGGSNAEVVIADAFVKGLGRTERSSDASPVGSTVIDYELALEAMVHDAEADPGDEHEKHGRGGLKEYNQLGYIPYGIPRAGTRTVEYAFNDWCIAQVARGLGNMPLYRKYKKRSGNWRNLWRSDYSYDGMSGFILPRNADGQWMDSVPWGQSKVFHPLIPYTPVTKVAPWYLPWWSTFFYEATSEEYSLSIPHDIPGLIRACGGKKKFRQRLDLFFEKGYYNVANEPSFLSPCLYHWIGRPDLSTQRVHQIVRDHYTALPDGLPGNDDSGAMSSWLAFHTLGLYPNAGHDYYLLNLPMVPEYTFQLADGRRLHVVRQGDGDSFKAVMFNGKRLKNARIAHAQLMQGGELVFLSDNKLVNEQTGKLSDPLKGGSNFTPFPSEAPLFVASQSSFFTKISFTLNRQFRTWPFSCAWQGDTLQVVCKQTAYLIPRQQVEHATGFCWLSPQVDGIVHHNVEGTFCFLSADAFRSLLSQGFFRYDGITWRRVSQTADAIHVRADIDQTEMWISLTDTLPLVLEMRNNPLGIDWKLKNAESEQK